MNYPINYPASNGGIYIDPITSVAVTAGACNYAPVYPCSRTDFLSSHVYETRPYNPREFSLNNLMRVLIDIRSAEYAEVLDSNVTLTPAITTAQKTAISTAIYTGLNNL